MSKYQNALFRITDDLETVRDSLLNCSTESDDKLMQELVDKATPKKPQLEGDGYDNEGNLIYDTWICPNCGEYYEVDYDDYDYCPCCGQSLDMREVRNEN